jgi:hypothetical protein
MFSPALPQNFSRNNAPEARRPGNLGQFLAQLRGADPAQPGGPIPQQGSSMAQLAPMAAQQGAPSAMQQLAPMAMQQQQAPSPGMPEAGQVPGMGSPTSGRGIFGRPMWQRPEAKPQERSKHIFGRNGAGWDVVGSMADVMLQRSGLSPIYGPNKQRQDSLQAEQAKTLAQRQWEYDQEMQKREWAMGDEQAKRNAPQQFMSNGDRVQYDPVTGEAKVVYDAQEPFDAYAQALGLEQGTPEYVRALQDYVLRSSGPTAYDYDVQLDGVRTGNDIQRKQAPTYRQSNPLPRAAPRGRKSGGGGRNPTATGPGGKKIEWNGSAWVPAN